MTRIAPSPIVGATRLTRRAHAASAPRAAAFAPPRAWASKPLAVPPSRPEHAFTAPSLGNAVRFHPGAEESLQAMLDVVGSAKESLNLEFFIWHDDASGRQVADAVVAQVTKARAEGRPFQARVLLDASALNGRPGDRRIVERLRAGGVEVLLFNESIVNRTAGGVPITHRKLVVADGARFYTGGRNVGDEYLAARYQNLMGRSEVSWTDLALSVEGPEAQRIWKQFMSNWALSGGAVPARPPAMPLGAPGKAKLQSIVTNPHRKVQEIAQVHRQLIASAQSEIFVSYPYFSDDAFVQALIDAKRAKPWLRIRALFPGSGEGGTASLLYGPLNLVTARQLAEAGIEVRFTDTVLRQGERLRPYSHQKAMLVDGRVLSVGSANADARTMTNNHELNLLVDDPQSVPALRAAVLEPAWAQAKAPTPEELRGTWLQRLVRGLLEALDFLL